MHYVRTYFLLALVLLGCFVATTAFAQSKVNVTETARKHFRAGVAYIDDPTGPKYEEAYREFHKAYAESPSYKILSNIGLCALNLERDGEAIDAYQRFLADAKAEDIPQDKRKLMERDIAMLKASLVTVSITVKPGKLTLQDERLTSKGGSFVNRYEVTNGELVLGIHPGHHRVTATAEGFEPQTWDFEADSASSHERTFELQAKASPAVENSSKTNLAVTAPPVTHAKKSIPTLVYVGAAATGVFAIGATVTGIVANSKKSDFDEANTGENPSKAKDLRNSGKTFSLITDIGIGAAALSAIGTAIVYFTTSSTTKTEVNSSTAKLNVSPAFSTTVAGLNVSGQF
jgi:hypothetical protein